MSALENKIILVISPQEWGKMLLSKHHYAVELARAGNKVFFLNPPDQKGELPYNSVQINKSLEYENLFLISHRLYFPFWLKFKVMSLFQRLMYYHVKKLLLAIGKPVDIVWSFDPVSYTHLTLPTIYSV